MWVSCFCLFVCLFVVCCLLSVCLDENDHYKKMATSICLVSIKMLRAKITEIHNDRSSASLDIVLQ